jgi:hypothetical protein
MVLLGCTNAVRFHFFGLLGTFGLQAKSPSHLFRCRSYTGDLFQPPLFVPGHPRLAGAH